MLSRNSGGKALQKRGSVAIARGKKELRPDEGRTVEKQTRVTNWKTWARTLDTKARLTSWLESLFRNEWRFSTKRALVAIFWIFKGPKLRITQKADRTVLMLSDWRVTCADNSLTKIILWLDQKNDLTKLQMNPTCESNNTTRTSLYDFQKQIKIHPFHWHLTDCTVRRQSAALSSYWF